MPSRWSTLDPIYSDYNPESEISRLSRLTTYGPMTRPVAVSPELYDLLQISDAASRISEGAFDITVGPFAQLWRRSRRLQQRPSDERLAEARASVGFEHVEFPASSKRDSDAFHDGKTGSATQPAAGRWVRPDRAAYAVGRRRHRRRVRRRPRAPAVAGARPCRSRWSTPAAIWRSAIRRHIVRAGAFAIQDLTQPDRIADYLELSQCGVSTSGGTRIDSSRSTASATPNIVDPRTGLGLTHRIGATTIAPTGVTADWLATAVSVLGLTRASRW